MSKHRQDKITGFGALIFGLVMLKGIIPHYVVTSDRLNLTSPDTFPNFASWGLIILGLALLIKTYLEEYQSRDRTQPERREKTAGQGRRSWDTFLNSHSYYVIATFLDVLLFAFLLDKIGYLISSLICCCGLLAAYRTKKWYYYVTVIGFTLVLYYVFRVLLHVKMP